MSVTFNLLHELLRSKEKQRSKCNYVLSLDLKCNLTPKYGTKNTSEWNFFGENKMVLRHPVDISHENCSQTVT